MKEEKLILVTNDDGYDSKGLVIGLILGSLFLFAAGLLVFFISVARML